MASKASAVSVDDTQMDNATNLEHRTMYDKTYGQVRSPFFMITVPEGDALRRRENRCFVDRKKRRYDLISKIRETNKEIIANTYSFKLFYLNIRGINSKKK